ncbi:hypothetical protein ACIQZN_31280 [Streptomyces sp. NPDC097595]|uniref:hypothetical protein n=1 Tax=Streptomyces sp. NPDC097595 TaxID=3366090 RepID=UPI003828271C
MTAEREPISRRERPTRAAHGVDEAAHPMIRAHLPALLAGTQDDRLSWGFDLVINGIIRTPVPDATD